MYHHCYSSSVEHYTPIDLSGIHNNINIPNPSHCNVDHHKEEQDKMSQMAIGENDSSVFVCTKYNVIRDTNETKHSICATYTDESKALEQFEMYRHPHAAAEHNVTYTLRTVNSCDGKRYEIVKSVTSVKVQVIATCDTMGSASNVQNANPGSRIIPVEYREDTRKPGYWETLWKAVTNF